MSDSVSGRPATSLLRDKIVTLLMLLIAPLALEAVWLYLSRRTGFLPSTASADTLGIGLGIAVGCLSTFRMRLSLVARLCFLITYIVTSAIVLAFFDLIFVCSAFQQCL